MGQRMILSITKDQFMIKLRNFLNNYQKEQKCNIISIVMFNDSTKTNEYQIEHVWIVRIDETDIGISFVYDNYQKRFIVNGIHVDKESIINQHELIALPGHDCHCLDNFQSNITEIKIGNPDADKNRYKDMKKRFNDEKE